MRRAKLIVPHFTSHALRRTVERVLTPQLKRLATEDEARVWLHRAWANASYVRHYRHGERAGYALYVTVMDGTPWALPVAMRGLDPSAVVTVRPCALRNGRVVFDTHADDVLRESAVPEDSAGK